VTGTVARMLATMPGYYRAEPLVAATLAGIAGEVDRVDRLLDDLLADVVPSTSTDKRGLLSAWERALRLPVAPLDLDEQQRRGLLAARLAAGGSAADVLRVLDQAVGPGRYRILRDTPGPLVDTLELPQGEGGSLATVVYGLLVDVWPAHRDLRPRYGQGFVLDESLLDRDGL
jgi:hypothetical protein